MTWAQPAFLQALVGVGVLALLLVVANRRHHLRLQQRIHPNIVKQLLPIVVRQRRGFRDVCAIIGLALLMVALAEPLYDKQLREVTAQGVDLVLVVDVSRSMDCRDVDPNRLERARREILDLISLLEGDRVGLVIYAGGAYPRMPLSSDYRALEMLVRELDTSLFSAQGSALDQAIDASVELLSHRQTEAGRAILILSDGEVHDIESTLRASTAAADAGVVIYGMGIGTEPSPIPTENGTYLQGPDSTVVMSRPSPLVLTDVARLTGGAYVQSVASAEDMARMYQQEIRGRLRSTETTSREREMWRTGFQWPLAGGLLLLLLSAWIGDGRTRRFARDLALCSLLVLSIENSAYATTLAEGNALYDAGKYEEASEVFLTLGLERPDDADVLSRLGAARYRAADYVGAAHAWERALTTSDDIELSFNAANARWLGGHLDDAVASYRDILTRHPDHEPAQHNLTLLLEEMRQREEQQHQPSEPTPSDPQDDSDTSTDERPSEAQGANPPTAPQSDGDPSENASEGEVEEGQRESQTSESSDSESKDAKGTPDDQGLREQHVDGIADLTELTNPNEEPTSTSTPSLQAGSPSSVDGNLSPAQAEKLLEGVEEGRPRVTVPGHAGDHPW